MTVKPLDDVAALLLDAICVVNEEGVFQSISGACEQIFGYAEHEMVGKQMLGFVYEPDRPLTLAAVGRLMNGYTQYDLENRYVRKDGSIAHLMWSARWYPEKKIRVAVARDMTLRKSLEQSLSSDCHLQKPLPVWRLSDSPPSITPPNAPPVSLSKQDYIVLATFSASNKVVSRKEIVQALGQDYLQYDQRRLDTQMRRLRRKIVQSCGLTLPITTLRGEGYRFYETITR